MQQAADAALARTGAARWVRYTIGEVHEERFRQEKRGRPGKDTRYRRTTRVRHRLGWRVDEAQVAHDAASDGCFPLITNDREMSECDSLKWPHLER